MEECYEYLGCDKKDCVMYGRKDGTRCWEAEGTLCNHIGVKLAMEERTGKKEDACAESGCIYYQMAKTIAG